LTLLRESGNHSGLVHDYNFVNGEPNENTHVEFSSELLAFAEAAINGQSVDGFSLREALTQVEQTLGDAALVDAAAVIAIFDAVVRIADATGIPLEEAKEINSRDFRAELGIDDYRTGN